jgi:hypothetical protein
VLRATSFLIPLALVLMLSACGSSSGPTATPVALKADSNEWTFSGALSGSDTDTEAICTETDGVWTVDATGAIASGAFDLVFGAERDGTFDYARTNSGASEIKLRYSPRVQPGNPYGWEASAGDPGTSGTLTIDSRGSGSLHVTLPPSHNSPGLVDPITIDARWVCP